MIKKEHEIAKSVAKQVDILRHKIEDPEIAHQTEKRIWRDVLHLAALGYDVQKAAEEALQTIDIDFPRWFA